MLVCGILLVLVCIKCSKHVCDVPSFINHYMNNSLVHLSYDIPLYNTSSGSLTETRKITSLWKSLDFHSFLSHFIFKFIFGCSIAAVVDGHCFSSKAINSSVLQASLLIFLVELLSVSTKMLMIKLWTTLPRLITVHPLRFYSHHLMMQWHARLLTFLTGW